MAIAVRDQNKVTSMIGVSSVDGSTPIKIVIDSVTGHVLLKVSSMGVQSSVTNRQIAYRDENKVPVMLGESSADDGTLVNVVVDAGVLRVKGS